MTREELLARLEAALIAGDYDAVVALLVPPTDAWMIRQSLRSCALATMHAASAILDPYLTRGGDQRPVAAKQSAETLLTLVETMAEAAAKV